MKRRRRVPIEVVRMVVVGVLIAFVYISRWVSSSVYAQVFGEAIK